MENNGLIDVFPHGEVGEGVCACLKDILNFALKSYKLRINALDLKFIVENDLKITTCFFSPQIVNILLESFVFYCQRWKEWYETLSPSLNNENLYKNFVDYLMNKCVQILITFDVYREKLKEITVNRRSVRTQTKLIYFKNLPCPYKLIIGNETMIAKHLAVNRKSWTPLTMTEFLNWPNVSVEVELLDYRMKRASHIKVERYITSETKKNEPEVNFITHVTSHGSGSSYTYSFFSFFFTQLLNLIKKMPSVNEQRLKELSNILAIFLEDIKEMNIAMGSMRTSTTIGFLIGNHVYCRTKKIITDHITPMNLMEYVFPQVDLTLDYFKAEQDMDDPESTSFKSLNALTEKMSIPLEVDVLNFLYNINHTCITYTCIQCATKFSKSQALQDIRAHFAECHNAEESVTCEKCGKKFGFKHLVGKRWKHVCN